MKKLILILVCSSLVYSSLKSLDEKQQWQQFLMVAELSTRGADNSYTADLITFKTMLKDVQTLNALPLWRATIFYQKTKLLSLSSMSISDQQLLVKSLIKEFAVEYTPEACNFVQKLICYKNTQAELHTLCSTPFTRVANVKQMWQKLNTDLIEPLTSSEFIKDFQAASFITKAVACDIMRNCIDTIDSTIKIVKASNDIPWNERKILLKMMINDFNTVMVTWLKSIMPETAIQYHYDWPLDSYLYKMQELKKDLDTQTTASFQRSPGFSVNAAILGSTTAFERHYPETYEDLFMLIHQNSLIAIASTYATLFAEKELTELIALPAIVIDSIESLEQKARTDDLVIQRIGMNYGPDDIELLYNMPLRNHSSTLQIRYNQITKQCAISVQFLGEARGRWEQISYLAAISSDLSQLQLTNNVTLDTTAGIVAWSWNIENSQELSIIIEYLKVMKTLSFQSDLQSEWLLPLHKGPQSFKQTMQQANQNYQNRYGNPTNQLLLSLGI